MANAKSGTEPSTPSPAKPRKVIDVTAPGKSQPAPSGKPIIVSNRPVLRQDPMVLPSDTDQAAEKTPSRVAKTIKIVPLNLNEPTEPAAPTPIASGDSLETPPDPVTETTTVEEAEKLAGKLVTDATLSVVPAEPAKTDKKTITPKAPPVEAKPPEPPKPVESPQQATKPTPAPTPATEPEPTPEPTSSIAESPETASDGQLAASSVIDEAKKREQEQKAAKLAEQEKIITSKQYFLPINSAEHRRSKRRALVILVVALIIVVVWADIMLDAGLIKINGLHPLTNFFSE